MLLNYASIRPQRRSFTMTAASAALIAFSVVYAGFCMPAMRQRGYPPIAPDLQGMTLLWMAGVPLSALLAPFSRRRAWELAIYSGATGFIDAASWPMMVPNHFDPVGCLVLTALIFGPIHLGIAAVLELICRWIARASRRRFALDKPSVRIKWIAAVLVVGGAVALPWTYVAYNAWKLQRAGRSLADADWNAQRAESFGDRMPALDSSGGFWVEIDVDEKTHLPIRQNFRHGLEAAYGERLNELIRRNGTPPWAEPPMPTSTELIACLVATDFTEVKTFPFNVSPTMTLFRAGAVTRFGKTMVSIGTELSIGTPLGQFSQGDNSLKPAFIKRDLRFPRLTFVRSGSETMFVFDDAGRLVASVDKR